MAALSFSGSEQNTPFNGVRWQIFSSVIGSHRSTLRTSRYTWLGHRYRKKQQITQQYIWDTDIKKRTANHTAIGLR